MLKNNSHQRSKMKLIFYLNLGINLLVKRIEKPLSKYKKLSRVGLLEDYLFSIKHWF